MFVCCIVLFICLLHLFSIILLDGVSLWNSFLDGRPTSPTSPDLTGLRTEDWGGVCLIVCLLRLFSIIWWDTYCTGLRWCLFVSVWLLRFQPSDDHALLFIQDWGGVQHWQSGRWWAHSSSQVGSYFVLCHLIGVFTFSVNWLLFSSLSSVLL